LEQAAAADASGEEVADQIRIPLELLVGAPERVERLAEFIIEHWEKRRAAMKGKATIVTMSREIAARLYEAIKALRPGYGRSAACPRTSCARVDNQTCEPHQDAEVVIRVLEPLGQSLARSLRAHMAARGLFVVTAACNDNLHHARVHHLDRATLMQAIARVNRVYGKSPAG
jgi:type I restriction enzyme R subunit